MHVFVEVVKVADTTDVKVVGKVEAKVNVKLPLAV